MSQSSDPPRTASHWVGEAGSSRSNNQAHARLDELGEKLESQFTKMDYSIEQNSRDMQQLRDSIQDLTAVLTANQNTASGTTPGSTPTPPATGTPQGNPLPYAENPVQQVSAERKPDGRLNLERFSPKAGAVTIQEERIKTLWPEAILPSEAMTFPKCESKNKVVFPPNLKLVWADETVFDKLREIQHRLQQALVPYDLWAQRVSIELTGDFQQVAIYAKSWKLDWMTFLEAIIQVLNDHHQLHGPMTRFSTLLPHQNESLINFARRIREAFYRLPQRYRNTHHDREVLIHLLRTYMPTVWLSVHDHADRWNTQQMVEEAVRRTSVVAHREIENKIYSTPEATVQLHGTSAPFYNLKISEATPDRPGVTHLEQPDATMTVPAASRLSQISDPRHDDQKVNSTEEHGYAITANDNTCFNCGMKGHWAKDCQKKAKFPGDKRQEGKKVTLKGTLYDNSNPKYTKFKSAFNKWKGKTKPKVHFTNDEADEDDEDGKSPAERLQQDESEYEQELEELFKSLENED